MIMRVQQHSGSDAVLQPIDVVSETVHAIDSANDELRRLNLEIYNNPEILFQETRACKLLSGFFEARGWSVKRGVYGIETAFEARFSVREGGRTVCFNAEYGKYLHTRESLALRYPSPTGLGKLLKSLKTLFRVWDTLVATI